MEESTDAPTAWPNGVLGSAPAIHLSRLHKRYGEVVAVDGVDLVVAPGEIVALLGPNGAGKSAIIDLLLGLTVPDSGKASVFGISPQRAVREGMVGALLQRGALLDDATVAEMVTMVSSLHRSSLNVNNALERAGVSALADHRGSQLSERDKQLVRFALALVNEPGLLVLDEPTEAMDAGARAEFWESTNTYADKGRTTMLFATHRPEEAEEFADRIVLLNEGHVIADGPASQIRAVTSGRTLYATIPGVSETAIQALPAVLDVRIRGNKVEIKSSDSDVTLRMLLSRFPNARGITITNAGPDEAILALGGSPLQEVSGS